MKELIDYLDRISEEAGRRHNVLTASITNQSKSAMNGSRAFSHAASVQLKETLTQIGQSHFVNEVNTLDLILAQITRNAHRSALEHLRIKSYDSSLDALSERFSQSEQSFMSYLSDEIAAQIKRDLGQVLKRYRNASLRVLMLADTGRVSEDEARMQVMIDEMNRRDKLWFKDRTGRKIPSQKHMRRIWRQSVRDHWIAVYSQVMVSAGIEELVIWHPDRSHGNYGRSVDITKMDYGLDGIDEIERVFHPNSRAIPVSPQYMKEIMA